MTNTSAARRPSGRWRTRRMDELKPCPFCGGEALLEPYRARKGYEASIQCNQCLCSMSTITYDEEETAIEDIVKAWNRRVNDGKSDS